ncbi:MAG: hypothetical protein WCI21_03990, partial [Alphaproteobacteria bacterium]
MQIPIRLRLILIPALVVLASLAALAASEIGDARSRVKAETESGLQLARLLIESALARTAQDVDPATAIAQLEHELPPVVRHVTIRIEGPGGKSLEPPALAPTAPRWFVGLIAGPPVVTRFPIA